MPLMQHEYKKMNLNDARIELERHGFKIIHDPDDEEDVERNGSIRTSKTLVGVLFPCCLPRWDTIVFITHLQSNETLTKQRIENDLKDYVCKEESNIYLGMKGVASCPPQGCYRVGIVLVVYYLEDNMTLDAETLAYVRQAPPEQGWKITFVAVQDGNGLALYMPAALIPTWDI